MQGPATAHQVHRTIRTALGGAFYLRERASAWTMRFPTSGRQASADLLERARLLAWICREHGRTLPAAATHFPLRRPAVTSVVVGHAEPEEVDHNLAAYAQQIPDELSADLEHRGLLRPVT